MTGYNLFQAFLVGMLAGVALLLGLVALLPHLKEPL